MEELDYDLKMLTFANKIANTLSKDKSTKVGAVITNDDGFIISNGYNGIPRKMKESEDRIYRKDGETYNLKYVYTEHAERNAIYNIGYLNHIFNNKIILNIHTPDIEEARAFISSGNKTLIVAEKLYFPNDETKKHILNMFSESNAKIISICHEDNITDEDILKILPKLRRKVLMLLNSTSVFGIEYTCKDYNNQEYRKIIGACSIIDINSFSDLAIGNTGFTSNLDKTSNLYLHNTPSSWRQGAIKNAIFSSLNKYIKGSNIYTNLCPCLECAKAILSVGIKNIKSPTYVHNDRLSNNFLFEETEKFIDNFGANLSLLELDYY